MKTKVNNNIKLKSGGGLINDTNGLYIGGTLPTADGSNLTNLPLNSQASDALVISSDTSRSVSGATSAIVKTIQLFRAGSVRVKFTASRNSSSAYVNLKLNGTNIQTPSINGTPTVYSYDVKVGAGDLLSIEIVGYGDTGTVSNFRIYYDKVIFNDVVILD